MEEIQNSIQNREINGGSFVAVNTADVIDFTECATNTKFNGGEWNE